MLCKYPGNSFKCFAKSTIEPTANICGVVPPPPVPDPTPTPTAVANQVKMEQVQEIDLRDLQIEEDKLLEELNSQLTDNLVINKVNPYMINCKYVSQTKPSECNKSTKLCFVIDSGAFPHMCNQSSHFSFLSEDIPPHMRDGVTLADNSKSPIKGICTVAFTIKGHMHILQNVLYVPNLTTSLFSVKQHCQQ